MPIGVSLLTLLPRHVLLLVTRLMWVDLNPHHMKWPHLCAVPSVWYFYLVGKMLPRVVNGSCGTQFLYFSVEFFPRNDERIKNLSMFCWIALNGTVSSCQPWQNLFHSPTFWVERRARYWAHCWGCCVKKPRVIGSWSGCDVEQRCVRALRVTWSSSAIFWCWLGGTHNKANTTSRPPPLPLDGKRHNEPFRIFFASG